MPQVIGILGGGQLGRMLALAAVPLGFRCRFYDPSPDCCARDVGECANSAYDDLKAVEAFCAGVDVITYEFENIALATARVADNFGKLRPSYRALECTQDRVKEKALLLGNGLPSAEFLDAQSARGSFEASLRLLHDAEKRFGLPLIVKTARLGYDGRGQIVCRSANDFIEAARLMAQSNCIIESFINFSRELSQIACRGQDGEMVFYPLVENRHYQGILIETHAPADGITADFARMSQEYARKIAENLDFVGVFCVELFDCGDRLLVNEIAPRVHNSGHWSIEGASTSQFENHIRAISGLPIAGPKVLGESVMFNAIGGLPQLEEVLKISGAHFHSYRKAPAAGRKVGHITLVDKECDGNDAFEAAQASLKSLTGAANLFRK